MKHISPYHLYGKSERLVESISGIEPIQIEEFLEDIGIPSSKHQQIEEWWNENRKDIKIYYFPFKSQNPIAGVFLGSDSLAINSNLPMPPHVKLFLALHESRHCDQHSEDIFMSGYYDTVVNGDKEEFLQSYLYLERDANNFALNSMRELGFQREMDMEEMRLRSNESAGGMVYQMMTNDIKRLKPKDFIDLLKMQIS